MVTLRGHIISIFLFLTLNVIPSFSQQGPGSPFPVTKFVQRVDSEKDLAQARQFEQEGQYAQAVELYERVLKVSPLNAQALSALPRLYIQLQRYGQAVALLEQQVQRSPKNIVFRQMLAEVLLRTNREDDARHQCQAILDLAPGNESVIRLVASLYSDHGKYSDALDMYLRGRTALHNPDAFALEMAELYTALSDVPNAITEYVRWAKLQPGQFSVVDDRIEDIVGLSGPEPVQQALEKSVAEKPASIESLKLLGNFHIRRSRPADALEQYRVAERLSGSKGIYLLEFASWCIREQSFDEAISAYSELMSSSLSKPVLAQASLGLAQTYHKIGRIDEAKVAYQHVVSEFPRTPESEEAIFQMAELQLTLSGDPQAALTAYRALLAAAPKTARREDIAFRIADCHIARGSMQDAVLQYNWILDPGASGLSGERTQERAKFRLAEIALFQGQFDEAAKQLNAVAEQFPGGTFANDALQWTLLIEDARSKGNDVLQAYVDAVLLERQYRTRDALDAYKQFLNTHPNTPVSDLAVLEIGLILDDLGKPLEAIAAYRDMIERYPSSQYGAEAQRRIAEIYERRLHDASRAIAEYETLLEHYPDYFSNDTIRRKISNLTSQHPPTP